jgi:hypothetical protein
MAVVAPPIRIPTTDTRRLTPRFFSKRSLSLPTITKKRRGGSCDVTLAMSLPSYTTTVSNLKSAMRRPDSLDSDSSHSKRSVQFVSVTIREHARDIDVNPSVSSGPALGLGWAYNDHAAPYDFLDFEDTKPPPRARSEFQMPRSVRERLLGEHGVHPTDMANAVRLANLGRRQRAATMAAQEVEEVTLAVEWVQRKMQRVLKKRQSYEKEEQQLWVNAQSWVSSSNNNVVTDCGC